jgi:hypothetical protein
MTPHQAGYHTTTGQSVPPDVAHIRPATHFNNPQVLLLWVRMPHFVRVDIGKVPERLINRHNLTCNRRIRNFFRSRYQPQSITRSTASYLLLPAASRFFAPAFLVKRFPVRIHDTSFAVAGLASPFCSTFDFMGASSNASAGSMTL